MAVGKEKKESIKRLLISNLHLPELLSDFSKQHSEAAYRRETVEELRHFDLSIDDALYACYLLELFSIDFLENLELIKADLSLFKDKGKDTL